jgi:hypothetical protein
MLKEQFPQYNLLVSTHKYDAYLLAQKIDEKMEEIVKRYTDSAKKHVEFIRESILSRSK